MLGKVKAEWNPLTTLVSFKLETDFDILEKKAKGAIEKYGIDMVVANELHTRRTQVTIYGKEGFAETLKLADLETKVADAISENIVAFIVERLGLTLKE